MTISLFKRLPIESSNSHQTGMVDKQMTYDEYLDNHELQSEIAKMY